jgi:hypothetical protein
MQQPINGSNAVQEGEIGEAVSEATYYLQKHKTKFNKMPVNKNGKGGLHGKASTTGWIFMDVRGYNHRDSLC